MKVLIVEDERLAARHLARMLQQCVGEELGELTCVETLQEAKLFLQHNTIDVLFLDLNLNGSDGSELLSFTVGSSFDTIVVSANTDRALTAFEYGVLDFVPKPLTPERLHKAVARVKNHALGAAQEVAVAQLAVRHYGSLVLVAVDDVVFFKGAGDYVEIYLKNNTTELHSSSLEALEKILPPHFERVHKSYLVDMRTVRQIRVHGGGRYELELSSGQCIPLSRSRYKSMTERRNGML